MSYFLENDLLVRYDPIKRKFITYRLLTGALVEEKKVLHTEYPLDQLIAAGFDRAGSAMGESIIISFDEPASELLKDYKKKSEI